MDGCRSSSSSSSRWSHPAAAAWSWTRRTVYDDEDSHGVAVDVGRFLPSTFVPSVPRPPPPPPLPPGLLPLAGSRYGRVKLERVPTPTRADRLLVSPADEHAVTLCFPRHSRSPAPDVEDVKLQVTRYKEIQ